MKCKIILNKFYNGYYIVDGKHDLYYVKYGEFISHKNRDVYHIKYYL